MLVRSGFSFHAAIGSAKEVVSRLQEVGATTAAFADTCSTYGFVKLTKAAEAAGLRVVYGVELLVVEHLGEKRLGLDRWVFLAKDALRPLHNLIYLATKGRRVPSLSYPEALAAPGLVKIASEAAIPALMEAPQPDLYLGLSPASNRGQVKAATDAGHPLLALPNNRYPRAGDREFYRVTLGRSASTQTFAQHIVSDDEWCACVGWVPRGLRAEALGNRDEVLAACRATLHKANLLVPDKPKDLRTLCREGAARLGCDLDRPVYAARLERELSLIEEKAFADYFHIVADLMAFARTRMVVGPARGSSCGSLVCYLLGITAVDPIPFGLMFERFIDVTRQDLPDIDIDLSEQNRGQVFQYIIDTYGYSRSARLGSVNSFKAKAALRQIGDALKIPSIRISEISNVVAKRSAGDARAEATVEDALETEAGQRFLRDYPEARIVQRMEGHPAAAAQHAAGVILTDQPILDYVAVNAQTGAAMCDKRDAEALNLLKIDALGLTQLSVFERCLELIGQKPLSGFLEEKIPLHGEVVRVSLDVLNQRRFSGIFQFQPGTAVANLVDNLLNLGGQLETVEDLVALTAIVRPGPLKSGQAEAWVKRRAGRESVSFVHPALEPHLSQTLGLLLFQEQILSIGREVGGLSWEDVTGLRKAMSKSLGREVFDRYGEPWKAGAMRHGIPREVADTVWRDMIQFGMWAFNRAHSVAYGIVSYWCCWLKHHYPLAFAAASLDSQKDTFQQIETLRELRREGIEYKPVDVDRSTARWEVGQNNGRRLLVGPLTNVVGIGPRKLLEILDARENQTELKPGLRKLLVLAKTPIDSLEPIHDAVMTHDLHKLGIVSQATPIAECQAGAPACIYGLVTRIKTVDENEPDRVAKRGYAFDSLSQSLNFWVRDDTAEIFCKISRWHFNTLGKALLEQARVEKSLFAIKGVIPADFRMIRVERFKYIGELDDPEPMDPEPVDPEPVAADPPSPDRGHAFGPLPDRPPGPQLAFSW
jgi:DNA polymerase III alpha subunit